MSALILGWLRKFGGWLVAGIAVVALILAFGTVVLSWLTLFPADALWLWAYMPAEVRAYIPENITNFIAIAIFVISIIARIVKQDNVKGVIS